MAASSFSWERFDDVCIAEFAKSCGCDRNPIRGYRIWLERQLRRPNIFFASKARQAIENSWLVHHDEIASRVAKALIEAQRLGSNPAKKGPAILNFLRRQTESDLLMELYTEALIAYGTDDDAWQPFSRPDSIEPVVGLSICYPTKQRKDCRQPYPHQRRAWIQLNERLNEVKSSNEFRGLLVMPTGSGKTYTAARWLLENHVNQGGRVLWIAHRTDLLEQAARAFCDLATFASPVEQLRVRIVAGGHCPSTTVSSDDHVTLWSIQSMSRRLDLAELLVSENKVFVVVDEAHHAPASTYRKVIAMLDRRKRKLLLGLTATPTRTGKRGRLQLTKMFGNEKIYEVNLRPLVEKGLLARPIPESVETGLQFEVTDEDLDRFGDLSIEWLGTLAEYGARNQVIVSRYLADAKRYGKTLVFAIDVNHAALLCDAFNDAGIEADYVASYRKDGALVDNGEIIERFRKNGGGLDVLINVELLTEGTDIPEVQTVFLARPTGSEILLRQMIGRALRGTSVPGGTELAYIVSFEDHWSRFGDWEHPLEMVPDIWELEPDIERVRRQIARAPDVVQQQVSWEVIREAARVIRAKRIDELAEAVESVPAGWVALERVCDSSGQQAAIPVYQHQRSCWEALVNSLWRRHFTPREGAKRKLPATAIRLYDDYFGDCDEPRPAKADVGNLLVHFQEHGTKPVLHPFEVRAEIDPIGLAREILNRGLNSREANIILERKYRHPLVKSIYRTETEFKNAVTYAKKSLTNHHKTEWQPKAEVDFSTPKLPPLRSDHKHLLPKLLQEVLEQGAEILKESSLPWRGRKDDIVWTKRRLKSYFGKAFWDRGTNIGFGQIRINRLLASEDVSEETVRYLIWHEYLHLYFQEGHTPRFRMYERRWPTYVEGDRELDTLGERYQLIYK